MSFSNFREIDKLGRIVIPKDIRHQLDINPGDVLRISAEDGCIKMTRAEEACVFCGAKRELFAFGGKHVCKSCAEQLSH